MLKIDKRNASILSALDFNARSSLAQIGSLTRLSKQTINYRIKQLESEGIIKGYYAVIDTSKMGYTLYRLGLKFSTYSPDEECAFYEFCLSIHNLGWFFQVHGRWDVVLSIYAKDISEFYAVFRKITSQYGSKIIGSNISIVLEIHNYPHKFLSDAAPREVVTGGKIETTVLDDLDRQILQVLSSNARSPVTQIANKLKQQPRTILYRIKKMKNSKLIKQYRAKIDTSFLGYDHTKVLLYLQNLDPKIMKSIMEYLKIHPNVIYSTIAVGLADLEFEAKTKNAEQLYQIVMELRQKFPNQIKSWDSIIIRDEKLVNYFPFR